MKNKFLNIVYFILCEILRFSFGSNGYSVFEVGNLSNPIQNLDDLLKRLGSSYANPVSELTTPGVIKYYGYPVEIHRVQTEDGYILNLHRIPHGKNQKKNSRPVVFLQHGLFASSYEWFMNTPDKLLAFQLVNSGYDVWVGNARGNAYSRSHVRMSPENLEFWEFSMHEMGKYDLPASIDYILRLTRQPKLSYVGFSMGTSMFWIMMSLKPEYNKKISMMTALAPVAYINNMKGFPRTLLAPFIQPLKKFVDSLFHGEFLPPTLTRIYNFLGRKLCSNALIAEMFCANINFLYAGWDLPQTQFRQLPLFYAHTPSPTSSRTLAHISQLINRKAFEQYDFGFIRNIQRYGQSQPPKYNLKNAQVPIALIWGLNDAVVEPIDVKRTAFELPNVVFNHYVNFSLWNHFDYHLARDTNVLVNQPVMKLIHKYHPITKNK